MTKIAYNPTEVTLSNLMVHPKNVRAKSGQGYEAQDIAPLSANIQEFGLLQPLLVQELENGKFGVLAGGRRLEALKALSAEGAKGFGQRSKVQVNVVDKNVDHTVALSLSENILSMPMDALDRFEAFSAMMQDGSDVSAVARAFGSDERAVRNSMRLGQIHSQVRDAYRNAEINLECLKAFAGHPDQSVQLDVFKQLQEENALSVWHVRNAFTRQFTRKGSVLGQFVLEEYLNRGGEIQQDLIDEDSVLKDDHIVQAVLNTNLNDRAEDERARHGFAWSDCVVNPAWDAFQEYGRVYPEHRDLTEAEQHRIDELAVQIDAIAVEYESAQTSEEELELEAKSEALEAELDQLQYAYSSSNLAKAGVIAVWRNDQITFEVGMVRPGETSDDGADAENSDVEGQGGTVTDSPKPRYSAKLTDDLKEVRTRAVAIALAQSPTLARDYLEFCVVARVMAGSCYYTNFGMELSTGQPIREPEAPEGSRLQIEEVDATLFSQLEQEWYEQETDAERFTAFRELPQEARDALLAYATSKMLLPTPYDPSQRSLRSVVDAEALPNIRDAWTPDAPFLERLTKPTLIEIQQVDLGMTDKAEATSSLKKSEIVRAVDELFGSENITLDVDAQTRIANWAPDMMKTAPEVELVEDDPEDLAIAAE
jgi:ParB family chromosome partitioning protein